MAAGYRSKGTQCYRGDLIRILAKSEKNDLPNSVIQPMGFSRSDTESECEQDITGYKGDKTTADEERSTQRDEEEGYNWSFLVLDSIECYNDKAGTPEDRVNQLLGMEEPTEDDKTINPDAKPIPFQPIFHKNRQRDFIRRFLTHELGKRLDIKKLTRQISQCEPIYTLPYQRHKVPAGRLYVLADTSNRLMSHHYDAGFICADIIKVMGVTGLEIREFKEAPGDSYSLWPLGKSSEESGLHKKQWKPLDNTAEVLILSDMGQLTNENSNIRQSWLRFLQHLYQQGIKPIALSPVPQSYQCLKLKRLVRQVLWKSNGPLTVNPLLTKKENTDQDVNRVLDLLSITTHIEPELLRETVQLLGLESGIEALVSNHPDVQWGYTAIAIKADKKEGYQKAFSNESLAIQRKIIYCIRKHHSNQFKGVWAEELINFNSISGVDSSEWQDEIDLAKGFMKRLAKTTYANQNQTLTSYGHRHLSRISRQSKAENKDYTSVIYGVIEQDNIRAGKPIPPEYDAGVIQAITADKSENYHLVLKQEGEDIWLRKVRYDSPNNLLDIGVELAEFDCGSSLLTYNDNEKSISISLSEKDAFKLPVLQDEHGFKAFQLDTGTENRSFKPVEKPSWASEIKYQGNALHAKVLLNGSSFTMTYEIDDRNIYSAEWRQALISDQLLDDIVSLDTDEYGLYADLRLFSISQRFRYIEPGSFMMGSPEYETDQSNDEAQHHVTLTQGYWLADTCTTQQLWQAVMGENPSAFQREEGPVDSVSWLDCWQFIQIVKDAYPFLRASLPTEAQWEYACRAGTHTPFSFGETITSDQVNFSDRKNKRKSGTVGVKTKPLNPWGLYGMHGNVWEWCQDKGLRVYRLEVTDPGLDWFQQYDDNVKELHPLRGGSWNDKKAYCRASERDCHGASYISPFIGFRLSLGLELKNAGTERRQQGQVEKDKLSNNSWSKWFKGGREYWKNKVRDS